MEYYNMINRKERPLPYTFGDQKGLNRKITFHREWVQMIQDHTVSILGWIQFEKVRWLQSNNPEVPGLVYKLAPLDDKMRKLNDVRKLWTGILDMTSIVDVFKGDIQRMLCCRYLSMVCCQDDDWESGCVDSSLNLQRVTASTMG